ncbi:MAG: phage terminase large subunit [Oscillospiraceae bacterium]|nr:phage terminase large subunit [Oscillospiraceae bacterium]
MGALRIPQPNEKQRLFLSDRHRYIAYGGARGGGKSWAVRVKAALLCLKYGGIKVMIVRKTYPELQENHILPLCELLHVYDEDPERRLALYNDQKKHIVFPNGSRILFRYCDNDTDAQRFQGTEVDVLFVDEATQQSEERMDKLRACVRGVNPFPKRVYYTMNPGGEGHGWAKRLFLDRIYREGEDPEDYSFIPALVTDNTALMRADTDYVRKLRALPPKLRDAWLYGRWDIFEGQFFEDFRATPDLAMAQKYGFSDSSEELKRQRRFTHVIEAFDLAAGDKRGWSVFRSYDFGYGRPFSCAWWAVDYDGVLYRILELYGCTGSPNEGLRWTPEKQFSEIARIEREHPWLRNRRIGGVADPSIWDGSRGESVAETAARHGISFVPGENRRIPGWMQCHYRLQFDEQGYPRMYVFDNCAAFLRTVPLMQFSKSCPEDLDTAMEDHVCDEWRYACMSRPVTPLRKEEDAGGAIDPLSRRA